MNSVKSVWVVCRDDNDSLIAICSSEELGKAEAEKYVANNYVAPATWSSTLRGLKLSVCAHGGTFGVDFRVDCFALLGSQCDVTEFARWLDSEKHIVLEGTTFAALAKEFLS